MGNLIKTSRFISLILRHKPETIGITLDEHGWANVEELIAGVNKKYPIDMQILEKIVDEDDKNRYSFNEDKTMIRANQGHSIAVDVELKKLNPPDILYHGTGEKYVESIEKQGLIRKNRLYVHLSNNIEIAEKVGKRHGKPVIYEIDCKKMIEDGIEFFKSENNVWLVESVSVKYLKKL